MNRPPFLIFQGVLAFAFLTGGGLASERPLLPNIIIMMADDMGPGDTSAYLQANLMEGMEPIQRTLLTPNLEAFASRALVFTDAHAPASMCSSTRYSLLTGRFAHRPYLKTQGWLPHGPNPPMIQRALKTLPEMLQARGYHTACIGKYHVGMTFDDGFGSPASKFDYRDVDFTKPFLDGPTHHGFAEFFGVPGNTEDPLDTEPRIFLRNDRWTFSDRSRMKRIGMRNRTGRILAAPDWDLAQIGPAYLREVLSFLDRQTTSEAPFFLYYVPNANHYQRNPSGDYAVPEDIAGVPVRGQSRYSDGSPGGDRGDMILENDIAFGQMIEKLETTDDPRWPGHRMIENTLIIFTSDNGPNVGDNEGWNEESGGLRGKKAKLWEGGLRVPFLVSWPGRIEGTGTLHRHLFSLSDLYATLASVIGHTLAADEAHDSHDCLDYWQGKQSEPDLRPRLFFCHLGPPFLNDALAIRHGTRKLIVEGGLAYPAMPRGTRGGVKPLIYHDLQRNPLEDGDLKAPSPGPEVAKLEELLLTIHNRGYAREHLIPADSQLVFDDGWHNLRNDLNGRVGYTFRVRRDLKVTHLGLWDDQDQDRPARSPRSIPTENQPDRPTLPGEKRRTLKSAHQVQLHRLPRGESPELLADVSFPPGKTGKLEGEFRYLEASAPVPLSPDFTYLLTMTTGTEDGDQFHDPASHDGLSPLIHPAVEIGRSVCVRELDFEQLDPVPAFSDLHPSHGRHRLPVGPTLRFALPTDSTSPQSSTP